MDVRPHYVHGMGIVRERDLLCAAGYLSNAADNLRAMGLVMLADEIDSFLDCVQTRSLPLVTGAEGLRALEIATMISGQL